MACIAVFNQKGGGGKTTTTLNLAGLLMRRGDDPLVIDLDPQAHLTAVFRRGRAACRGQPVWFVCARRATVRADLRDAQRLETGAVASRTVQGRRPVRQRPICPEPLVAGAGARARRASGTDGFMPDAGRIVVEQCFCRGRRADPISADYLALKRALQMERMHKALEHVLKRRMPRCCLITT